MSLASNVYYVWEFEATGAYSWYPPTLKNPRDFDSDEIEFKFGDYIAVEVPHAIFIADPREDFTDYQFNIPGIPLFSRRLRETLSNICVDNIQYFPVKIITKHGKILKSDYMIANVLGKVKCLDWERSSYDDTYRQDGFAVHINKLVLDPRNLHSEKLFRMEENSNILLVDGSVRSHLDSSGITGIRFTELEELDI